MKKKIKKRSITVGIAWYRPTDYRRLLELSDDREDMHTNYLDWEAAAKRNTGELQKSGQSIEKIDIDLDEIVAWCKDKNIPLNGSARSQFVAYKLRLKHTAKNN